jgi:hypothetical protein
MGIMSHDEFTKLFKYLVSMKADMDKRFNKHDKRFVEITTILGEMMLEIREVKADVKDLKQSDTRQNRWIHELAYKTDTKLSYE